MNCGYIPVKNCIVTVQILDDYNKTLYKPTYYKDTCSYITNNYKILNILDCTENNNISKIDYEYNENYYKLYFDLDAMNCNIKKDNIQLTYIVDNIYYNYRYYYKNFDVALSKIYMSQKLYLNKSSLYKNYNESGYVKEEFYHINGKIQGTYKKYYNQNELEEETEYIDGKKHGFSKKYNGSLDSVENYIMGKKNGLCIYNNIGRCGKEYKTEITFNMDNIEGTYKKYHPIHDGGLLNIECNFINNKYNGIYKEYDKNGILLIECDYKIYNKEIKLIDII